MSRIHYAKFNFNEDIYKIYDNDELREEFLYKVFSGIDSKLSIKDKDGTFKFISLHKNSDEYIINGRVVLYAPGTHISYNQDKDDVNEVKDDKMAQYITFSFHVRKEIVGFVPKRNFGKNQFVEKFSRLVEGMCEIGEVKMYLETDLKELQEKLKVFSFVKSVDVRVIPPNSDRDDFAALMGSNAEQIKETKATKFEMSFMGTAKKGINIASTYIQKWIGAITRGYGEMSVKGENSSHDEIIVHSKTDALFTRPIHNNSKDSIPDVAEKTRAGISELLALKVISKGLMTDGDPKSEKGTGKD